MGLQNEKYICLDFAWILGAVLDGLSWIYVGLIVVVLVARPFILSVRLHGARGGVQMPGGRMAAAQLNARKLGYLRAFGGV